MALTLSRMLIILSLVVVTCGCTTLSYYSQSVRGQWQMMSQTRPIADLLADPDTSEVLKDRLRKVLSMREFAVKELALPDNASYRRYADLGRSHVVWNVFAAERLSVEPLTWCFPIVGCLVYRGYFSEQVARDYALELERQGYDTMVAGISAYSTLGWFSDPVLNTFVGRSDAELAGLIFHELSHQVVYIKDDSVFNESLATAVELEGMRRWLQAQGDGEQMIEQTRRLERRDQFIDLLLEYRQKLDDAYRSEHTDDWKTERKKLIIEQMRGRYRELAQQWQYSGYDNWFAQNLNNAHFISASAYYSRVPAFTELMRRADDIDAFWLSVERLSKLPVEQRNAELDALASQR